MVCQWDRNPEISLSSRNNPEMSQHSSDVPMLAIFSIYIFPWDILWTGLYRLNNFQGKKNWYFIGIHWNQKLLTNRNCPKRLMFPHRAKLCEGLWGQSFVKNLCIFIDTFQLINYILLLRLSHHKGKQKLPPASLFQKKHSIFF